MEEGKIHEDRTAINEELEQISESFICCVCLDLVYKPIVLACGHMSCFWCVHKSMSGFRWSNCPICRDPYFHFPSICQKLHFLLLKMYPITYGRREEQVQQAERERDRYSPQIDATLVGLNSGEQKEDDDSDVETIDHNLLLKDVGTSVSNIEESEAVKGFDVKEKNFTSYSGHCGQVSTADLLCVACNELLYHPVVLNCGHVCCKACVTADENKKIKCHVCQSTDPRGFPKVCLVLNQFLEENFHKEYALRKHSIDIRLHDTNMASCSRVEHGLRFPSSNNLQRSAHPEFQLHIGIGCDSCGIFPLIGDRYRCRDCTEAIGYDLCKDCYNTRSNLSGRFNQQHTAEHRFELLNAPHPSSVIRQLAARTI